MAEFRKMIITVSGKELLSKAVAESTNFAFTKVVLSAHDYADNEIALLEQLSEIRQELPLYKVLRAEDSTVEVTAILDNSDVSDGYQYAGIGLYAQIADEPETLFAACGSDVPGHVPSNESPFRVLLNLQIGFSGSESVSLLRKFFKLLGEQLQSDWSQSDKESPDFIKNKPIIETPEDNSYGLQMVDPWEPNDNDGTFSTALGSGNLIAKGANYSLTSGFENSISNAGKQNALGLRNILSGNIAQAIGRYNTMKGVTTIGIGERNNVGRNNAIAVGCGLVPTTEKQVVIGQFNAPKEDAVFVVGSGVEERQNAMTISKDGTMTVGGYFVDDVILPGLKGVDNFTEFNVGDNIGINSMVEVTGMLLENGKYKTARFVSVGGLASMYQPQANLGYCYVVAGRTYKLNMTIYPAWNNPTDPMSFWLAAMPKGDEDHVFEDEADWREHLIYTHPMKSYQNDRDFRITDVEFTPDKSGFIRFGLNDCPAGAKYSFGYFVLDDVEKNLPVYNYKSVSGDHTETLYRVGDVPCSVENIKKWLSGKTVYTEYGPFTITDDVIKNDVESWCDKGNNYIVIYKNGDVSVVLICIVDCIAPKDMGVSELGIYVSKRLVSIPYKRWVDTPWTDLIDKYIGDALGGEY